MGGVDVQFVRSMTFGIWQRTQYDLRGLIKRLARLRKKKKMLRSFWMGRRKVKQVFPLDRLAAWYLTLR